MAQRVVVERLLPIPRLEGGRRRRGTDGGLPLRAVAASRSSSDLLPRHVQVQVYRALLESNAAFFAAQMTAMDAATRNAAEMIDNLTLYMNKVRQAAITREIIEVVSGAQRRRAGRQRGRGSNDSNGTDSNGTAHRQGRSGHRPGHRHRVRRRASAGDLQRGPHRRPRASPASRRSTSSPKSSSTSARTACAPSR